MNRRGFQSVSQSQKVLVCKNEILYCILAWLAIFGDSIWWSKSLNNLEKKCKTSSKTKKH